MLLNGSEKADTLTGGVDADTLYGYGGNDKLTGGAGDDVLAGMAGNDTLLGGEGEDYILGGAGSDTLDGGAGADWAAYEDATSGVKVDLNLTGSQNTLGGGGDKLISIENVYGSAFNDTLIGDAGVNYLAGGDGHDSLSGGKGEDNLFGGAGADTLLGGQNDDYMQGGAGNDTLDGGDGSDWSAYDDAVSGVTVNLTLTAAQNTGGGGVDKLVGVENVYGSAFSDNLTGDAKDNTLIGGGTGNDTLSGGQGDDFLQGGSGNDVFDGGAGFDTVSFENGVGAWIDLAVADQAVTGNATYGADRLISIEGVIGSAGRDYIAGNAAANYLAGGDDSDFLVAVGGGDVLDAGAGDDTLGASKDGAGDYLSGGAGADTFFTQNYAVHLDGGEGNDVFQVVRAPGMVGTTIVDGGAGVDTLNLSGGYGTIGGATVDLALVGPQDIGAGQVLDLKGVENIVGGPGNDHLKGDANANVLTGGAGDDTLSGGEGLDFVSYLNDGFQTGANVALWQGWQAMNTDRGHDTLISIEGVEGSAYGDHLDGNTDGNILRGNAGNDVLWGRGGADTLEGGEGDDYLASHVLGQHSVSSAGSVLVGGAGRDTFETGLGGNTANGDAGDDRFLINNLVGDKVLDGGEGVDTLQFAYRLGLGLEFEAGVTVDLSVSTAQTIAAGVTLTLSSMEQVWGTDADDQITGNASNNYLDGLGGDDVIVGGAGDDTLSGREGADTLTGGAGKDLFFGGEGADTFVFSSGDAGPTRAAADVIDGFSAQDRIVFTDGPVAVWGVYREITLASWEDAQPYVDDIFANTATRYMAVSVNGETYLFADTGAEGTTYDQVIQFLNTDLSLIDVTSIIGV